MNFWHKLEKFNHIFTKKQLNFSFVLAILYFTVILGIISFVNPVNFNINILKIPESGTVGDESEDWPYLIPLPTPEKVKGIYLTGYSFSSRKARQALIELIKNTELNTMVIDLKDPNNKLSFYPQSTMLKKLPISSSALDNDLHKQILADLQDRGIYTIARITTFQDNNAVDVFPDLALKNKSGGIWQNWQGIAWLDMTNPDAWILPILQAKEAARLGYDEIQFDYIRFPSDGNTGQIKYFNLPEGKKKYETLTEFYAYTKEELKDLFNPLSIDLFGLTYQVWKNPEYDLNIGQRLTDAASYFNYISPMVYPSHYPAGYMGFSNPANHPYPIINKAMADGNIILANTSSSIALSRPWLQDFDLGADYNVAMVKAQIKACDNNNCAGWLLWNPRNIYTIEALKKNNE